MAGVLYVRRKMIRIILLLLFLCNPLHAEIFFISIFGKNIGEKTESGSTNVKFLYSLHSPNKKEQLSNVPLKELTSVLPKVEHWGSSVLVSIYSTDAIPSYDLLKIIEAIHKNNYLELIHLKSNIRLQDLRERAFDQHKLKEQPSSQREN